MSYETAIQEWQAGERRLRSAAASDPDLGGVFDRVVAALVRDLRRRLGGPFSAGELVALYGAGTDWCLDVAVDTAPDEPRAWDAGLVGDAAFARYVREATDFAGGRLIERG